MAQSVRSRDSVTGETGRQGAHRSRPTVMSTVLPALAVTAAVAALAVMLYTLLIKPNSTALPGSEGTLTGSAAVVSPSATGSAPASSGTPSADASSPTPNGSVSPSSSPSAVDPKVIVNFYNASTTAGLSRKASNVAKAAGWRIGSILPWKGAAITVTTIYVSNEAHRPAGQSLAGLLKTGVVKVSAAKAGGGGVSVIIAGDYTPQG